MTDWLCYWRCGVTLYFPISALITENISDMLLPIFTGRTACTDATAHPQHGHHRTTSCTTCSVRLPGRCTPQRQARCPDTSAPGLCSPFLFLPSAHLVPPFYERRSATGKVKAPLPLPGHYGHYRPVAVFSASSRFINQPVRNFFPVIIVDIVHHA